MNFTGGLFSQISDLTGLTSFAKWFGDFNDENMDEMTKLLREWPDCPPDLKKELEEERPPPKGKIHHHLAACRNDPVLALEHIKLLRTIREAFREHICSKGVSDHVKFKNFRSAVFRPLQPHDPKPEQNVVREFCHGKIGLVGASEEGGVTYLLNGRLHIPSESEGGFPRESSIRLGALVLARLSMLAKEAHEKTDGSEELKPPPEVEINVVVDLTDSGTQNLDRGFGLSMGELIEAINLRQGDDPIPTAPCVRFRKMIIINANWVYTAVWAMVKNFVPQHYLDVISFDSPSQVPDLVKILPSRLPSSLGGDIPLDVLLSPSLRTSAAPSSDDASAAKKEAKSEAQEQPGVDSDEKKGGEEGKQEGELLIVPGTCRWFEATTKFFVDPPLEWQGAVPSLDAIEGMTVTEN